MTKWESKTLFIFPFSFMWSKRCLIELKNDFGLVCFCTTLTRPLGLLCLCLSCFVCFRSHHRYPYNVQERGECFVVFDYVVCVCTLAIWDSFLTHPFCIFGKIFFWLWFGNSNGDSERIRSAVEPCFGWSCRVS